MAATTPLVFRWGIISTGAIAECFMKDALVDPKTRGVHDVEHKVTAVGSRSVKKAQGFVDKLAPGDASIKAYGTYEEVYADPNVDAVYIGTPHTHHYTNAKDALLAKKHVLCEKPITVNGAELRSLLIIAKEQGVFLMEAMWTRFQPLVRELVRVVEAGELGEVVTMQADLSADFRPEGLPLTHRMMDPHLGGGALLDLGPYPTVWAIIGVYENQANERKPPSAVSSTMIKTPRTKVDQNTAFTLTFSSGDFSAHANLSCAMNVQSVDPTVTIRYRKGAIQVFGPPYRPHSFVVKYFDESGGVVREDKRMFEYVGLGYHYEMDEVAKCVREGKQESEVWGWDKSLVEMDVFDEVRRQGGYKLPAGVEKVGGV